MLKAPSEKQRIILDHADYIENLDDNEFNMGNWDTCICGHFLRRHGYFELDDWKKAASMMGICERTASEIFTTRLWSKHRAASRLREVAWNEVD